METEFYLGERARIRIALRCYALILFCVTSGGCAVFGSRNEWTPPTLYSTGDVFASEDARLCSAEAEFAAGRQAEEVCNPAAVDHYFSAATQAWPFHVACTAADDRATKLYRSSVRQFIDSAVRFGRFDRRIGVTLASGQVVPVGYQGFVWQPEDFCTFLPVGFYESARFACRYTSGGVGVPYVVLSSNPARHAFTNFAQPFAATAVLAPADPLGGSFALQFYDPLRASATTAGLPLARDLSAPLAYAASQESDAYLEDFLRPYRNDSRVGLHMREPFQLGKIPIVFVHGLASDPLTWAELENDLRAQPAIFNRYQFWFFRYATGDPFLGSAARLRLQLTEIRRTYDPLRCDPNLSRMVLVGHSMGGLLAKLQVTCSGDLVWQAAATQPFNTIVTDPATRADLAAAFFFQPSPDISRVIFLATPHRGSNDATRCVGRLSSALIQERPDWVERHEQLIRDNPCAFRDELHRRVPNSVDLLEPGSLILQSTDRLPYRSGVALHSVIGDDRWTLTQGRSDGVVPVSSARLGGGESELVVETSHSNVQRDSNSVREVICILNRHAAGRP